MFINICKSLIIGVLSLIGYIMMMDSEKDKKKNPEDKNKEYIIIVSIIAVISFLVIQMSQTTNEIIPVSKAVNMSSTMLNNKPPF